MRNIEVVEATDILLEVNKAVWLMEQLADMVDPCEGRTPEETAQAVRNFWRSREDMRNAALLTLDCLDTMKEYLEIMARQEDERNSKALQEIAARRSAG